MTEPVQTRKITVAGVVLTVFATLGFIWAGFQWCNRYNWPRKLSAEQIRSNEVHAYENLKLIVQAQTKYKQRDWDNDGRKTYADFLVHLRTSVSTKSEPIPVELISKKLAFAMGPAAPVDGYYFKDLHDRGLEPEDKEQPIDLTKEWAVASMPADYGKTGCVVFLADDSGRIFAKFKKDVPQCYPYKPLSKGWVEIGDLEQFKKLQDSSRKAYPTK